MLQKFFNLMKAPIVLILRKPTIWFPKKISSSPESEFVFRRLSEIYADITQNKEPEEGALYQLDMNENNFII